VGEIMGSIKKYSARRANSFLMQDGSFWQSESFNRLIRDDVELYFIIRTPVLSFNIFKIVF
jgi:putative transposase